MPRTRRTTERRRTRSASYCTVRGRLWDPRSFAPDDPPDVFVTGPGRFHLYLDGSPQAHRSALVLALAGLEGVVSVSGTDVPTLEEAYLSTGSEPGGALPVPALWDRRTARVVTNHYPTLERDLATEFADWSSTGRQLYPADLRDDIDEIDRWLAPVNGPGPRRRGADGLLDEAFARLDRTLARSRYLLGDRLTLADVRLWVMLVRIGGGNLSGVSCFANLWAYARALSEWDEFRAAGSLSADFL